MATQELKVGNKARAFKLPDQDGATVQLKDFSGKWVILYFYPKDNTPGCTVEAIDFTAAKKDFGKLNAVILGVSPDSVKKHRSFCDKKDLTITLISDEEKELCIKYGVWQKKKNYGKEYMGVVRSTFLIDPEGTVAEIWRKAKVKGHVEAVLEKVRELS